MAAVLIDLRDYRRIAESGVTTWHSSAKLLGELLPRARERSLGDNRLAAQKRRWQVVGLLDYPLVKLSALVEEGD
jgi:hypothetical protein